MLFTMLEFNCRKTNQSFVPPFLRHTLPFTVDYYNCDVNEFGVWRQVMVRVVWGSAEHSWNDYTGRVTGQPTSVHGSHGERGLYQSLLQPTSGHVQVSTASLHVLLKVCVTWCCISQWLLSI